MEVVNLKEIQKKESRLFIKMSRYEKSQLVDFCKRNQVSISDLVRETLKKVINQKTGK
mgnify:CR=1 FL=1